MKTHILKINAHSKSLLDSLNAGKFPLPVTFKKMKFIVDNNINGIQK